MAYEMGKAQPYSVKKQVLDTLRTTTASTLMTNSDQRYSGDRTAHQLVDHVRPAADNASFAFRFYKDDEHRIDVHIGIHRRSFHWMMNLASRWSPCLPPVSMERSWKVPYQRQPAKLQMACVICQPTRVKCIWRELFPAMMSHYGVPP